MIVVAKGPQLEVRSQCEAELVVEPADISFHDLNRDRVEIRVKIRNQGQARSLPTFMRLECAPFGAFVPWRPLTEIPLPPLEPGEVRELGVEAARPHPEPLGSFDGVPPVKLLTALNASPDEPAPAPGAGLAALLNLFRRPAASGTARNQTGTRELGLPADWWEFFGREQPHWAGNINVFVGQRAVERHVARSLRIYAGRTNLAMFAVGGSGRRDAYAFDLNGLAPGWKAALFDTTCKGTFLVQANDAPVQERHWVEPAAGMMLQVQVTRRSSGEMATVEFDLDPTAQGAGCYVA
jgi:hypothetical protein